MEKNKVIGTTNSGDAKEKILPKYEPPRIITYTEEDILEQIGPAQACSPSPGNWTQGF